MNLRFTHLFWDFDGTLYDTYGQITHAMLYALGDMGQSASPAQVYALLKTSVYHACVTLAERFSLPAQELRKAFQKHHAMAQDFPQFQGLDHCLYSLKKLGCKHYLYTHRDRKAIRQLEKDDLSAFFTGYVTSEDGFPHKPAPNALQALMTQYSVPQSEAVMIGDRDLDILAGHNAGIAGILFDPQGFFLELAVEYRVRSMEEVLTLIKGEVPSGHTKR